MDMIVATNNQGKLREIKSILKDYKVYSLKEKEINIEVEEDQDSFLGNAKKKAIEIYNMTKEPTIADDSGICINILNGFPGVITHRFLGENATSRERNEYLIKETNKYLDRSAYIVCVIVYYDGKNLITSEGKIDGFISKEIRGNNNFGFDEIFELENGNTLAELDQVEKNKISARAIALAKLKQKLKNIK